MKQVLHKVRFTEADSKRMIPAFCSAETSASQRPVSQIDYFVTNYKMEEFKGWFVIKRTKSPNFRLISNFET